MAFYFFVFFLACGSAIVVRCFVERAFSWVGALGFSVPVRPFGDEMGEFDRKLHYFSIKLLHFCAKPVEFLEWWVDVYIASSSGEVKVREKWMKLVRFVAAKWSRKRKSPASRRMRGLVLGIVRRRFLETSLETERECTLAVAVGQHLFADFPESGPVLGEGVFHTATVVSA